MRYLWYVKHFVSIVQTGVKIPRVVQHILFWIVVSLLLTGMYSLPITFSMSLRNNLFYMPVQIVYYYLVAYWLIPRFLFVGRYFTFAVLLGIAAVLSGVLSRSIGLTLVIPYMIENLPITDPEYVTYHQQAFWIKLWDMSNLVNAFKGTNLIIGFTLAIKLFKMWYERKQAALEAELSALKAQVHPHFLFNTLNNLYALSLDQSPKSPQLILGLSDILRYMLYECNTDEVPLEKEIFMMQQYVRLEKLRYEDRIDITFNIDGNLQDKLIAPLLILPFIENAFKHGVSEKTGDVWININITIRGNHFKLKVANSKAEVAPTTEQQGHIGLKNVQKRLELLYPDASHLKLMDDEDTFLAVLDLELNMIAPAVKQQVQPQHQPKLSAV
ncbi:histidine kinase [Mucilaginibacter conchicola]|uniref:Histidine kinase n=1 Tax=Mucilaginibacter conchicola TaxID=2303333 RepID=A0A372NRV6_9SPHI|nr:histidine kinase [Mucilaginibacter conchicola]RFZ92010.1 histidine kinase [Mucilaginibacter conchicola]